MPFLAMWMRLMVLLGMPFIIVENVPQFPVAVLEAYMGFMYSIHDVVTDNIYFGHVVKRCRRYTLLLKKSVWGMTRALSDVNTVFARKVSPDLSLNALCCAKHGELDCEFMWARSRSDDCRKVPLSGNRTRDDFINALNDNERERLNRYLNEHGCSGTRKVCMLSQDPDFRGVQSSEDILATLVRQCHILWSDHHGRWFTGRELLLAQGFPMTDETLMYCQEGRDTVMPLCSYNVGRISNNLPPRSRTEMAKQAGNSMCTNAIGAIITFAVAFTTRRPVQQIPASPRSSTALQLWSTRSSLVGCSMESLGTIDGAEPEDDSLMTPLSAMTTAGSDVGSVMSKLSNTSATSMMSDALSLWSRARARKQLHF